MITGRRAFQGETKMSTLAAILHHEPKPASEVQAVIPRDVERIIARCLRKDPGRRIQTMIDLKVALEELKEESDSGRLSRTDSAVAGASPRPRFSAFTVATALMVVAAVAGVTWWLSRSSKAPAEHL